MSEAFIVRRDGSITTYDATNATVSVNTEGYGNKIVISGLNLPENISSFCINIIMGVNYSTSSSSGGSWCSLVFMLHDTGEVTVQYMAQDWSDGAGSMLVGAYEVSEGNLYLWILSDTTQYKFYKNSSKQGLRGGIVVCS